MLDRPVTSPGGLDDPFGQRCRVGSALFHALWRKRLQLDVVICESFIAHHSLLQSRAFACLPNDLLGDCWCLGAAMMVLSRIPQLGAAS